MNFNCPKRQNTERPVSGSSGNGFSTVGRRNDPHRFKVSIGTTRDLKLWGITQKATSWTKFIEVVLETPTVDNSVTLAQYVALDRDSKNERKAAAGNWNFGVYKGERRKKDQLRGRWGLVFDFDYATEEQMNLIRDGLAEICRWEFHLHTTRSHTPEQPRWRLTLPFNRMANVSEAYAINRLMTRYLAVDPEEGVELVDVKSFDNNQIMFKPSISRGQEFLTERNQGEILNVDAFLKDHPEWTDPTALPHHSAEKKRGYDPDSRMEDPREKPEPIGAFCRAFTVDDLIAEHLSEFYEPSEDEKNRYRYAPDDGNPGAVVMDGGLFLHSFHGNDPCEGQHNAWDLARIHLFGHLDKDVREGTSPMNWPSSIKMAEWANSLPEVIDQKFDAASMLDDLEDEDEDDCDPPTIKPKNDRQTISAESEKPTQTSDTGDIELDDLDDLPEDDAPKKDEKPKLDMSWTAGFRTKGKEATIEPVMHNILLICKHDPRIAGAVAFDEFRQDPVATKQIRNKKLGVATDKVDPKFGYSRWEDGHDTTIHAICSAPASFNGYSTDFPKEKILGAVYLASKANSFHPVKDMMEAAHKRYVEGGRKTKGLIDQIPQRWLGCPDDAFHRESSRYLMLALVARTYEPGCKFDCVAILRGSQGGGKGRSWRYLARQFFADMPNNFDRPDKMVETMRGSLIGELGEMSGLRKETAEVAKAFITTGTDKFRPAYARRDVDFPRRGILTGTSNLDDILHDPTGNRRFWIWVDTHSEDNPINIDDMEAHLDFLYGEALDEYLELRKRQPHGELHLDLQSKAARLLRDKLADQYRSRSAIEEMGTLIEEYLDKEYPAMDVMLDKHGLVIDGHEDDDTPMVRNMVTAQELVEDLKMTPAFMAYRNADGRTFGKALAYVKGWHNLGQTRHHGKRAVWWCRVDRHGEIRDDRLWLPLSVLADADVDDLLS